MISTVERKEVYVLNRLLEPPIELDGPDQFTREPIEYMGQARLLDELSI